MEIRAGLDADADQASLVLRRSIEELCHADHGGDPAIIAGWVSNKTPAMWRAWVDQETISLYVAVDGDRILGVGMMDAKGGVMLNYVSPDDRFRGVSKALLGHMEAETCRLGVTKCILESSRTARAFYQAAGYRFRDGDDKTNGWMTKTLMV